MKLLKKWFGKTTCEVPQSTVKEYSRDEIIEIMYDKELKDFGDALVSVIYSRDRYMRYIILKRDSGIYEYLLQNIMPFGDWELPYFTLPAYWDVQYGGRSFFGTEKEALSAIRSEPEFKFYFAEQ